MISQLYWLAPNHILYWKLSGRISSYELCTMANFIATLIDKPASQRVHIVISCSGVQQVDYANQDVRDAFNALAKQKCLGKVTAIMSDYQIQAHWSNLNGAFGSQWNNVTSIQAAIQALKRGDSLIQDVPALNLTSLIVRP